MITFVMPANKIPEGTIVRKPTGQKPYTIKSKIEIHGEGKQVIFSSDIYFLIADGSINGIKGEHLLAFDLSLDDAIEYLESFKSHQ